METADRGLAFSLTQGGPFFRVLERLQVVSATGTSHFWMLGFVVWLPLALGEAARHFLGMPFDPSLYDVSMHVRVLITLPLLLYAERLLDGTVKSAVKSTYAGDFCDPAQLD